MKKLPIRADYIHKNEFAALGLATLEREPIAFHRKEDRAAILGFDCSLETHLPRALTLSEAANAIAAFSD